LLGDELIVTAEREVSWGVYVNSRDWQRVCYRLKARL